ncbi:thioesterase domain-containing protein [Chitinophaga rhizophila]|uniref:Alpha/beta fold hydrolase n=1 Tax=Chitinophaga rhizophila TaxID=2866212 RepID=A0ABS7GKL0_9BACT|nr:alpha/beta fold hydrolase [Chitinophaga rhizophila]MBW8688272.1 alpha/beta fold hydrolase [Chitinophaga rhizophila]
MDTRQVLQALQEGKISASQAKRALLNLLTPATRTTATRFPELVWLNRQTEGRPIFWIHGSGGGVEVYSKVAAMSQRPFYGIQARGWQSNRLPLQGIQAMSAAYVHAIQSLQPKGPYDLGGFSLGGTLAYEIARQLQEYGETVSSIVLVDVLQLQGLDALPEEDSGEGGTKVLWWQTVNLLLTPYVTQVGHADKVLIHRHTLDWNLDNDTFIDALLSAAATTGFVQDRAALYQLAAKSVAIQQAFETERYVYHPLPEPDKTQCYYFRNVNGQFLGDMLPYFSLNDTREKWLQQQPYWEGWKRYFPHFHTTDVIATNHMVMLSENDALATFRSVLSGLYASGTRQDSSVDNPPLAAAGSIQ